MFRATHRGTYENDILIGGFVRARLADLHRGGHWTNSKRVMDHPEVVLADWLTGRQPIPAESRTASCCGRCGTRP